MQNIRGSDLPSVMALSFLGDAVHSLFVREMLAAGGISKSGRLNDEARRYVTAEAQAEGARRVLPFLDERENEVYRRAHNSSHLNKPKHASGADYRQATGLEAVLGMLSVTGQTARIEELLSLALAPKAEENTSPGDTE
jgi:ribonuclease-3 family protein